MEHILLTNAWTTQDHHIAKVELIVQRGYEHVLLTNANIYVPLLSALQQTINGSRLKPQFLWCLQNNKELDPGSPAEFVVHDSLRRPDALRINKVATYDVIKGKAVNMTTVDKAAEKAGVGKAPGIFAEEKAPAEKAAEATAGTDNSDGTGSCDRTDGCGRQCIKKSTSPQDRKRRKIKPSTINKYFNTIYAVVVVW